MKVAFDTSVIVAALVEDDPRFESAAPWLDAIGTGDKGGCWTTHAYAEVWSVLTRLPLATRIDAHTANAVLESVVELMCPTEVRLADYREASARCAQVGGRSGIIFDALHLVVAEREGASCLLTYNASDFERLSPRVPIVVPGTE